MGKAKPGVFDMNEPGLAAVQLAANAFCCPGMSMSLDKLSVTSFGSARPSCAIEKKCVLGFHLFFHFSSLSSRFQSVLVSYVNCARRET